MYPAHTPAYEARLLAFVNNSVRRCARLRSRSPLIANSMGIYLRSLRSNYAAMLNCPEVMCECVRVVFWTDMYVLSFDCNKFSISHLAHRVNATRQTYT